MAYCGYIANAHRHTIDHANHHLQKLRRPLQIGSGCDVELALLALDAACGHFDIVAAQGIFYILHGEAIGCELVGIEIHAHRVFTLSKNTHIGGTTSRLQHRLGNAVGEIRQLEHIERVGAERQPNHGEGIGFHLGNLRLIHISGQALAHARDFIAHIGGSRISITREREAHRDLALLRARGGGNHIHAFNACEGIFQNLSDLRLHHFSGCTAIVGGDCDVRLINFGIFTHGKLGVAHIANQQDQEGKNGSKHRAADRYFWQLHAMLLY